MILLLFLLGVFFICMAMLWTEGLWGNALTFVNVIVSGMLAVTLWEPTAKALEGMLPSFTFVLDILAVWLVFAVAMSVLRIVTGLLSKYRVRFHRLMESIGNIAMAVIVALTMTAFAGWTLHLAPLAPMPFRGADLRTAFLANIWGSAVDFSSRGTMGGRNAPAPSAGFLSGKYYQRRQELAAQEGFLK